MYTGGFRCGLWFIISDSFLQQFPSCMQLGNPISNRFEHLYTKPAVLVIMYRLVVKHSMRITNIYLRYMIRYNFVESSHSGFRII